MVRAAAEKIHFEWFYYIFHFASVQNTNVEPLLKGHYSVEYAAVNFSLYLLLGNVRFDLMSFPIVKTTNI